MQLLGEARDLLGFLFTPDEQLEVAADAMPGENGAEILDRAILALNPIDDWTHDHLESVLRTTLIEDGGYKPRDAFGPLRSAISGRRISPPLFESMELLGKDSSLVRLQRLRDQLRGEEPQSHLP